MEREQIIYFVNLYFPDLLENGRLVREVSEEELHSMYLNSKAMIGMTRFNGNYKARLSNLGIAYSYLLNMIKNPHSLVDRAFSSYYDLKGVISGYGFVERDNRTVGQSQNEAQDEIMDLLGNFDELIIKFKTLLKENEDYVKEHRIDIESVVVEVEEQVDIIRESSSLYHNSLAAYKNGAASGTEVGRAKRQWRKEKNIGLQKALEFIREMRWLCEGLIRQENINSGIRIKDYTGIPINMMFVDNLKKIRKSRVYYSFISDKEKDELEKGKSL